MSIKKFEEIIQAQLEDSSKIVDFSLEKLLSTGENYGSVMYKADVKIKNGKGEEEILHLVAKTTPPKSWIWELFTTVVTFKKEDDFYRIIMPIIHTFLEERNLPGFLDTSPRYYGSRVTLQPNSNEVDEDAVLVLENLKFKGYEIGNRFVGFNYEISKAIINAIAKNHATFIAFKEAHPLDFEQKVGPPIRAKYNNFLTDDGIKQLVKSYIITLRSVGFDLEFYEEKMNTIFKNRSNNLNGREVENVFNTLSHNDLWTNNIMLKIENNLSTDVKLIDYQVIEYRPGNDDLLFFLYTSVELSVLQEKADYLIDYYFEKLIEALKKLKADTSKFTRQGFDETMQGSADLQLPHMLMLLPPIFTMKGKAKELVDFKPEDFKPNVEDLHANYLPRFRFIVTDFIKRGWL